MIIQCPSCQTKFAVDSSQLKNVDNPRFHCSRCNHYFEHREFEHGVVIHDELAQPVKHDSPLTDLLSAKSQSQSSVAPEPNEQIASHEQQLLPEFSLAEASSENMTHRQPLAKKDLSFGEQLAFNLTSAKTQNTPDQLLAKHQRPHVLTEKEEVAKNSSLVIEKFSYPKSTADLSPEGGDKTNFITAPWPDSHFGNMPLEVDMKKAIHEKSLNKKNMALPRRSALQEDIASQRRTLPSYSPSIPEQSSLEHLEPVYSLGDIHTNFNRATETKNFLFPTRDSFLEETSPVADRSKIKASIVDDALISDAFSIKQNEETLLGNNPSVPLSEKSSKPSNKSVLQMPKKRNFWLTKLDSGLDSPPQENTPWENQYDASSPQSKPSLRLPSTFAPVLFCLSVPIVSFLLLWQWSHSLSATPAPLLQALHIADTEHVAPAELEVSNISAELEALDNGKQVLEIKGDLRNNTQDTLSDVKIEARVFDKENRLLKKVVVDTFNGLINTAHINSLSEETIDTLQQKIAIGERQLKTTQQASFRVVITQPTAEATWFTARVYSVRSAGYT